MRTIEQLGLATLVATLVLAPAAGAMTASASQAAPEGGKEIALTYDLQLALLEQALRQIGLPSVDTTAGAVAGILLPEEVKPTCQVPVSPSQNIAGHYVRALDMGGSVIVQLWKETNQIPGLEPRDHLCPDGSFYPRDTLMLAFDSARPLANL